MHLLHDWLGFWHAHASSFEIDFPLILRLKLYFLSFLHILFLNFLLLLNDKLYLRDTLEIFLIDFLISSVNEIFFNNVLSFFLTFHLSNLLLKRPIRLFIRFILAFLIKMTFINILMSNINTINSVKLINRHYKSSIN